VLLVFVIGCIVSFFHTCNGTFTFQRLFRWGSSFWYGSIRRGDCKSSVMYVWGCKGWV